MTKHSENIKNTQAVGNIQEETSGAIRLNRYLAMCGAASRRKAEELLLQGRVRVNGKIVLLPSIQIEPGMEVTLDDRPIVPDTHVYLVMNKPLGYVCAVSDKYDPVVMELLPKKYENERLFPVGRLDRDTSGLLILTNDGELAQQITHPSRLITKEYEVRIERPISGKALEKWKAGYDVTDSPHWEVRRRTGDCGNVVSSGSQTELSGVSCHLDKNSARTGIIKPLELEPLDSSGELLRVVIGEGLKREVREMVRLAGYRTLSLTRRRIGKMKLVSLAMGECAEIPLSDLWHKIRSGGDV